MRIGSILRDRSGAAVSTGGSSVDEIVTYTGALPAFVAGNKVAISTSSGQLSAQANTAGDGWATPNNDPTIAAVTSSGGTLTIARNSNTARVFTTTLTENVTLALSGAVGATYAADLILVVTQDGTGGRTISGVTIVPDATLTTAANSVVEVVLRTYDNGATWYGTPTTLIA